MLDDRGRGRGALAGGAEARRGGQGERLGRSPGGGRTSRAGNDRSRLLVLGEDKRSAKKATDYSLLGKAGVEWIVM